MAGRAHAWIGGTASHLTRNFGVSADLSGTMPGSSTGQGAWDVHGDLAHVRSTVSMLLEVTGRIDDSVAQLRVDMQALLQVDSNFSEVSIQPAPTIDHASGLETGKMNSNNSNGNRLSTPFLDNVGSLVSEVHQASSMGDGPTQPEIAALSPKRLENHPAASIGDHVLHPDMVASSPKRSEVKHRLTSHSDPTGRRTGKVSRQHSKGLLRRSSFARSAAWPQDLQIREFVHFHSAHGSRLRTSHNVKDRQSRLYDIDGSSQPSTAKTVNVFDGLVMLPGSPVRCFVDIFVLCLIFLEILAVPFQVSWKCRQEDWARITLGITMTLWFIELILNFFTSRYHHGQLQKSFRAVASVYCQTWLAVDALAFMFDVVALGLSFDSSAGGNSIWTVARCGGLLRFLKIASAWKAVSDRVIFKNAKLAIRCLKVIINILLANHIVSCAWFALGTSSLSDTGFHWADVQLPFPRLLPDDTSVEELQGFMSQSRMYQYSFVYHLCMAQMTGGNETVHSVNSYERIFCALGLTMGLLLCSTVISSLSAAFIEYQMEMRDTVHKLDTLAKFLRDNNVRQHVAVSTQREVKVRLFEEHRLRESDVPVLQLLSSESRVRLRFDMFGRHMVQHPLFRLWAGLDPGTVEWFCIEAVETHYLKDRDDLFRAANPREECYMLTHGSLDYTQVPETSPVEDVTTTSVQVGAWLCEAALWTHWTSVGTATAVRTCQAFSVKAEIVVQAVAGRHQMSAIASEYGCLFYRAVVSAVPPEAPYPTDLVVPFTNYAELVMAMRHESQVAIGMHALDHMRQPWRKWFSLSEPSLPILEEEVRSGKSTLLVTSSGEPQRVTSVTVLELKDDWGRKLVQLCRWNDEGPPSQCLQLPGGKQERGEHPHDALRRLLETKLQHLRGRVQILRSEREVSLKVSTQHLIQTEYTRNIFIAKLVGDHLLQAPICGKRKDRHSSSQRLGPLPMPFMHNRTERSQRSSCGHLSDLLSIDVLLFGQDSRTAGYAWLTEEQHRFLMTTPGQNLLSQWLTLLDPKQEADPHLPCSLSMMELWEEDEKYSSRKRAQSINSVYEVMSPLVTGRGVTPSVATQQVILFEEAADDRREEPGDEHDEQCTTGTGGDSYTIQF